MPLGSTLRIKAAEWFWAVWMPLTQAVNRKEKDRHIHQHPAPLIRTECINRNFGACWQFEESYTFTAPQHLILHSVFREAENCDHKEKAFISSIPPSGS